jgi:hypothetical protein
VTFSVREFSGLRSATTSLDALVAGNNIDPGG